MLPWYWLPLVLLWVSIASGGLGLSDPSPPHQAQPSPGGLTLGPPTDRPPSISGSGGLTLHPLAGAPPQLPAPPPAPVRPPRPLPPPPFQPPLPPPPLAGLGAHCDCLKWDQEPNPVLSFFTILVSRTAGAYTEDNIRAVPLAEDREYPCAQLFLGTNGTYYAVIQAVGFDLQTQKVITSDYSNELCLTVQNRQVYACPGTSIEVGQCTNSPSSFSSR